MNFNSQICTTKEQSERLLNLGIKKETADCVITLLGQGDQLIHTKCPITVTEGLNSKKIPNYTAWSLDRLICMISNSDTPEDHKIEFYTKLNRYDEVIAMIQSLIHIGQFNKEYLT